MILPGIGRGAAGRQRLRHHLVDLRPAVARQGDQNFGGAGRVGDGLLGEALEEWLDQQHHVIVVLAHHHAGTLLVGELRVEGETQALEEGLAPGHVLDGQVHEDLAGHRRLLGRLRKFNRRQPSILIERARAGGFHKAPVGCALPTRRSTGD